MTRPKLSELLEHLEFAHRLADISGEITLPYFRKSIAVQNKAAATGFDPVTAADRTNTAAAVEQARSFGAMLLLGYYALR